MSTLDTIRQKAAQEKADDELRAYRQLRSKMQDFIENVITPLQAEFQRRFGVSWREQIIQAGEPASIWRSTGHVVFWLDDYSIDGYLQSNGGIGSGHQMRPVFSYNGTKRDWYVHSARSLLEAIELDLGSGRVA